MPTLLGLLAMYSALATYKIHSPGLYYDEMLFVGPAAGEQPYVKCFGLPLLIFPYIGALKSWIYTPIFALFGVSAVSIRLPTILISCGTLAFGYLLVRRILGPRWAVAFTGACAVHPGFVFLTKLDLGPIALMLFFKALCLVLLFKWLEGQQGMCWSVFGVCILGFFDKFNFIWFVVALAFSTSAIYGKEIFRKLKAMPVRVLLTIATTIGGAGLLVLWIVYPLLQRPHAEAYSARFSLIRALYQSTSTGRATAYLWFKSPPMVPSWTGAELLRLMAILLLLMLVTYYFRARGNENIDARALKFCLWCLLMFGTIFVEIVLTPQALGPHHVIMLFPFDYLALFSAAFVFANTFPRRHWQVVFLEGCVLIAWVASDLRSFEMHFSKFRDASTFRAPWSPRVEKLVAYLNEKGKDVDFIYTIDWGIGLQLRALCRPEIRRKVKDPWGGFLHWSGNIPDATGGIETVFAPQEKALYVSFVPGESVFPQAVQNFERISMMVGNTTKKISNVPPAIAQAYQIFEKPAVDEEQR